MTFPITPLPSIHNDIFDAELALKELRQTLYLLEKLLSQLAHDIIIGVINAILNGLGLGSFAGPVDALLTHLQAQITNLISNPIGTFQSDFNTLIGGIGGTGIQDVVNLLLKVEKLISDWLSAFGTAGVGDPEGFVHLLRGLLPAALPQFNGTALSASVPGFVDNLNGTIGYTPQDGIDALSHLVQQADGTVVTVAHAAQQAVIAATAVGAPNIGQAVAAGQQAVDHGVAALTGVFNIGQAAQNFGFQLGNHLTGVFNAKTGASRPAAVSADVIAAEQAAAAAAAALAQQTAAINGQLPHFYGGSGANGNNFSVPLTAYTPAGFTLTNGIELYTAGVTLTDQQTVSALWNNTLVAGQTRSVQLRSDTGATTYVVATMSLTGSTGYQETAYVSSSGTTEYINPTNPNTAFTINISCYVAGVQTSFQTWSYPYWVYLASSAGLNYYLLGTGYNYEIASANHVFTLEATANTFTVFFDQGSWTYTDSSNVSQIGSSYRSGGYSDNQSGTSTQISWDFYDSGPVTGPAGAYVVTSETTTSSTYTDLVTTTDQVTVNIGSSGMVIVFLSATISNNTVADAAFMSFAVSGANTVAATDDFSLLTTEASSAQQGAGVPFLLTGLTAGATTFKAKYRVAGGGTGQFIRRRIAAIPL